MRKTLGWTFVALLLVAVPAAAQEGQSTTDRWKVPSLEELADLPILSWIVQLVTGEPGANEEAESVGPTTPVEETVQLDGGTDTEARGGWTPEG